MTTSSAKPQPRVQVQMKPDGGNGGLIAEFSPLPESDGGDESGTAPVPSTDPTCPADPTAVDDVRTQLARFGVAIGEINEGLAQLATRDDVLIRVHERLAKYEEDAWNRSFVEPLTRKLVPICRRIVDQLALLDRETAKLSPHSRRRGVFRWSFQALEAVRVELETALSDFGVDAYNHDSQRFDRSCQDAVERVPTADAAAIGVVVRRISPGFRIGDRILIPERVAVYVSGTENRTESEHKEKGR